MVLINKTQTIIKPSVLLITKFLYTRSTHVRKRYNIYIYIYKLQTIIKLREVEKVFHV